MRIPFESIEQLARDTGNDRRELHKAGLTKTPPTWADFEADFKIFAKMLLIVDYVRSGTAVRRLQQAYFNE